MVSVLLWWMALVLRDRQSIQIGRLAVESRLFPLFEVKLQQHILNYIPKEIIPVSECMKHQGRFRHLFREGNEHLLDEVQKHTNRYWDRLVELEKLSLNGFA